MEKLIGNRLKVTRDFKFTVERVPRLKEEKLYKGNRKEIIEEDRPYLFGLIYGEHFLVAGRCEGNQNIGFSTSLGHRFHITSGAHGKAIAAFMPEADRERTLSKKRVYFHGLDFSRLNMRRLREEPRKRRQLGYAQDVDEVTPGLIS